jgi:glutathione S-transferase
MGVSVGSSSIRLVGRSSSHFTRTVRIFAAELGVPYSFRIVPDLRSQNVEDYAGNPALRLPSLETPSGLWFGSLNCARELTRLTLRPLHVVWPESVPVCVVANAHEMVLQAMSAEVALIMLAGGDAAAPVPYSIKQRESLLNILGWLEQNLDSALTALPAQRGLSYLEVTLFCLIEHLEFRSIVALDSYPHLLRFCRDFAQRPSAQATPFRFDA